MGNSESTPAASEHSPRKHHSREAPDRKKHHHHGSHSKKSDSIARQDTAPSLKRGNSVHTRYMQMLLHLDEVPRLHNILAAFCTWLLLAGFVLLPGTYTTLQEHQPSDNRAERVVINAVKNVPLLWVAVVCCIIGALGMIALWIRWRTNYIWVTNRIFLPGALNGLTGLISTLINVYTAQDHIFSLTAKITTIVTGSCLLITAVLFVLYNNWALEKVRRRHYRETEAEIAERQDEGLVDKISRKAHEKPLLPGSVV